jgi:hypothetical protein
MNAKKDAPAGPGGAPVSSGIRGQVPADLKGTTNLVMREALVVWTEIWKQFNGFVADGALMLPPQDKGWRPDCGWPVFAGKMWALKEKLNSIRRLTDPSP